MAPAYGTLVILTCFLSLSTVRADEVQERLDNWPQWRGPLATGMAPHADPPLKWDARTNIKWKVALPGRGSSTPIVWGDKIFVQAAEDTGRQAADKDLPKADPTFNKKTNAPRTYYRFLVLCLDRTSGKLLWQKTACERVPHEGHHPSHSYAAFSPVTDGKRVYALFGSQGLYCYNLDGKLLWQRDLGRMETRLGWGEGGSPVVYGKTLLVNWDHEGKDFLLALNSCRWQGSLEDRPRRTDFVEYAPGCQLQGQGAGHCQRHQRAAQLRPGQGQAIVAVRRSDGQRHPFAGGGRGRCSTAERLQGRRRRGHSARLQRRRYGDKKGCSGAMIAAHPTSPRRCWPATASFSRSGTSRS